MSNSYSGGTPKVGTSKYYGGKIPFIRSAEINSDTTELFLTEEGLKCSSARLVDTGDILYALYGATSGEVGRARIKGAINQAILVIKPQAGYDYEFLTQWLRKSKLNIIDRYLQGGQGNLSGTIVNELLVEFPNYEEQTKIGEYFSTLDRLITLHQRKCDETKKLKKFMLQKMFPKNGEKNPEIRFAGFTDDWEQRKLGEDLESIQTGTNLLGSENNNGMPLLKMGNIQRGYFDTSKLEYLVDNKSVEPENVAYYGDFFFNTRNTMELVGKGATWTGESGKYAFNSNIARFKLKGIDTIFFNFLYNTDSMAKQVHARAMGTTSVAAIYPRSLDSIDYCLPCIDEQKRIGDYFRNLDHLITLHQRKCDNLKLVKKFMLQNMFPKKG